MDADDAPPTEAQQLRDIRRRFYDVLWNFSVIVGPESSQATSANSNAGSENAIFPYRFELSLHLTCAREICELHGRTQTLHIA
jgi:hypothetical protein